MRHLALPVGATRLGMIAEQVVQAFWPLWTVAFLLLVPLLMGWHESFSIEVFWGYIVVSVLAMSAALIYGLRLFRIPTRAAAVARVDAAMPGRPIAAIADSQAVGAGDAASEGVWQVHLARMAERTKDAQYIEPDLRVSSRDPYALRFIALLFFVVALFFGSFLRVNTGPDVAGGEQILATGPVWEGWVEPPAYTGKPSIYLNDIPAGRLRVPQGSMLTLRLYGDVGALTVAETVSGRVGEIGVASDAQQKFAINQSGNLAIEGENGAAWDISVAIDQPPLVELTGPVESDAEGEMAQPFLALDDYGVVSGTATIALDIDAVDRVHGLIVDPDGFEDLVLDLPMPFNGDRTDFEDFLVDNLSQHPLANLPVTLTMEVVDAAGQTASSPPEQLILPGRRFFQPFAKAIIEQRRDLMWARDNTKRIVQVMKALSHRPEGLFSNETTYLRMRLIIRRLDAFAKFGITGDGQDEIVQAMWDLAIQLEDGTLADARKRLERAQERLAEAMRNGASDEEIAELMQELREATDDYMQLLADEMDPSEDGTDQPDSAQDSMEFTQDELQALMDRIQELMEEGRMAEAAELMEQLNQLLENMRITQGEGGGDGPQIPGQQSMEDLAETLREQEDLSDDAFRELQDRSNNNEQGQEQQGQDQGDQGQEGQDPGQSLGQQGQTDGQDGQDGQSGDTGGTGQEGESGQQSDDGQGGEGGQGGQNEQSLSERQQALRDELGRQRDGLPGLEGDAGEIARQSLERAEGAMDGAEQALRGGDLAEAIDKQAEAMDALRNGMRSLSQALAQNENIEPGQGSEQGETTGRVEPGRTDPLGRELGNNGQFGTDQNLLQGEDVYRRAEELLNELRRRSSEQERPQIERDYLRRLLDRF